VAAIAAAPVAVPAAFAAFWTMGGMFASGWIAGGAQLPYQMAKEWLLSERIVARLPVSGVGTVDVRVRHLKESVLVHDGGDLSLQLAQDEATFIPLHGPDAQRALGVLLARANAWGANSSSVQAAVQKIGER